MPDVYGEHMEDVDRLHRRIRGDIMNKRILVPLDDSARDAALLDTARDMARHLRAGIALIRIEPALATSDEVAATMHRLRDLAEQLRAEGLDVVQLVDFGHPAAAIPDAAVREDADFILLAPRHRGFLDALRHPSVTQAMLARAPSPLVVLPEAARGAQMPPFLGGPGALVIVPLDGSELAETALPIAIRFARRYARPLLLVRVVSRGYLAGPTAEAGELQRQIMLANESEALEYLGTTRQRLALETGLTVQTMDPIGDPAEQLVRLSAAHPGSLLVMTTHGRTALARAVLGSVSAEVARRGAVPMVIVPPLPVEPAAPRGGVAEAAPASILGR
jgi:nucleotide-binding universal stress UspA family protein